MDDTIYIVSGLPRSGTSMMMRVLQAGGLPVRMDNLRAADEDNPHGYFELQRVKGLSRDRDWLGEMKGMAIKVVAPLLSALPVGPRYRVIFMRRSLDEVLASQQKMLERRGEPPGPPDDEMRGLLLGQLLDLEEWLKGRPDVRLLYVSYNRMISDPAQQAERVNRFVDGKLAVAPMIGAVDARLYRQRESVSVGPQNL
jgi:hypothetical protein